MNSFSVKTRNDNLLKTRTKNFKDNIQNSESRMKQSSSLQNLATKFYSDKYNATFSPKKESNKLKSSKSSAKDNKRNGKGGLNPEFPLISPQSMVKSTLSMGGLSQRASYIPCYAQKNTELLCQKKDLQDKISALKQMIVQQKKLLNSADYNGKKNINEDNKYLAFYQEAQNKSIQLAKQINITNSQIRQLNLANRQLKQAIHSKKQLINEERNNCQNLEQEVRALKASALAEQKDRNNVKIQLAKAQRVMQSSSIYNKQLENERAMLLLDINLSVDKNGM